MAFLEYSENLRLIRGGKKKGSLKIKNASPKLSNTSDCFGFRFFGFHFEYGLITDETYSRRQTNTGTKFEVSHFHNIFVNIGQSGPSMD